MDGWIDLNKFEADETKKRREREREDQSKVQVMHEYYLAVMKKKERVW